MSANDDLVRDAVRGKRPNSKGWIRANCPLCDLRIGKPDRKASFGFHVTRSRFECYRCGATGRVKPLDEFDGFEVEETEERVTLDPPESFVQLGFGDGLKSFALAGARDYLAARGLSNKTIQAAGIGACTRGRFAGRVIIPVLAEDGAWLWYVGRVWRKKAERSYLYPKGDRRGVMFNHAALLVASDVPALAVEGCFDAIATWPDGVAVLGKPTDDNFEAFAAAPRPIAMVLDGDAHEEGWSLAYRLRLVGQRAGNVVLPPRVDPDEIPLDVLRAAAARSIVEGEVTL